VLLKYARYGLNKDGRREILRYKWDADATKGKGSNSQDLRLPLCLCRADRKWVLPGGGGTEKSFYIRVQSHLAQPAGCGLQGSRAIGQVFWI
jgi:hypothetical protein